MNDQLVKRAILREWSTVWREIESTRQSQDKNPDDEVWQMAESCLRDLASALSRIAGSAGVELPKRS